MRLLTESFLPMRVHGVSDALVSSRVHFAPSSASARSKVTADCRASECAAAAVLAGLFENATGKPPSATYGETIEPDPCVGGPPDVAFATPQGRLWCAQVVRASRRTSLARTLVKKVHKSARWIRHHEEQLRRGGGAQALSELTKWHRGGGGGARAELDRFVLMMWVPSVAHLFTPDAFRMLRAAEALARDQRQAATRAAGAAPPPKLARGARDARATSTVPVALPLLELHVLVPRSHKLRQALFPARFGSTGSALQGRVADSVGGVLEALAVALSPLLTPLVVHVSAAPPPSARCASEAGAVDDVSLLDAASWFQLFSNGPT